jgi:plastocyanin
MIRTRPAAIFAGSLLTLVLAACGGGSATSAPAASSPAASAPASSPPAAAEVCAPSETTGTVAANARGFAFAPATISVAAGEAVTWSNGDPAPHSVILDGGECETANFGEGESATLVFNVPGTYTFHCGVHPNMTGTIEVS